MTWYMGPHHRAPLQPDSLVPCCPEDCLDLDRRLAGPGRGTREQRLWQVLSDPLTQTGVLGAILSTQQITPRLLRAACRHPALPMSALVALGERYPDQFLANPAVRLQRATSPDWLFTLPYQTICAVIRSPLCPSSALERLSRDRRLPLGVRATAAGQPKLTTEQMARFMRHATTVRA